MLFLSAPARFLAPLLAFARHRPGRLSLLQTLVKLDSAFRERQRMSRLDPEQLRDIGIDPGTKQTRTKWDAPRHWRR